VVILMFRARCLQAALLVATLSIMAAACGGDGDHAAVRRGDDTPSSTAASSTASDDAGSSTTGIQPDSTPTTAEPAPTTVPPPESAPPPPVVGVFGTVTAGPTCPVAQVENLCDPRPLVADVEARTADGTLAARTHTDQAGAYRLELAPATYTLLAVTGSSSLPRCLPTTVTVHGGQAVQANIGCDTGIR
jgi:hypothetical protein